MKNNHKFTVAQIGKTVGLRGDLKLHLKTDFPQQFKKGAVFETARGTLTIENYNPKRSTVKFVGYNNIEDAKALTNTILYSDEQQTRNNCPLKEGEHYWFDIIGADIIEGDKVLGKVSDIQRMLDTDYLLIDTDSQLVSEGLPKSFLIPYIPRYILSVDEKNSKIITQDALDILEAS